MLWNKIIPQTIVEQSKNSEGPISIYTPLGT
jgi:hypothetical protein